MSPRGPIRFARWLHPVNTLRTRQNGRHLANDIFKCIFFNEYVWILIKISLKFVPKGQIDNIPALVQIMVWRRPGDKPLSGPIMVSLLTHRYITRPQWVNFYLPDAMIQPAQLFITHQQVYKFLRMHTSWPHLIVNSLIIATRSLVQCRNLIILRSDNYLQSGTKPNLVAKNLATKFGVFFVIYIYLFFLHMFNRNLMIVW